jgi:hypothetical protein
MNTRDALLSGKKIVEKFGDSKIVHSYYVEFGRRLEILKLVEEHCKQGSAVLDLGAQPFITSCALRKFGYNIITRYNYTHKFENTCNIIYSNPATKLLHC